ELGHEVSAPQAGGGDLGGVDARGAVLAAVIDLEDAGDGGAHGRERGTGTVGGPPAPARLKDAARRWRGRPGRPVLDPRRVGRPGLGVTGARGAPGVWPVRSIRSSPSGLTREPEVEAAQMCGRSGAG